MNHDDSKPRAFAISKCFRKRFISVLLIHMYIAVTRCLKAIDCNRSSINCSKRNQHLYFIITDSVDLKWISKFIFPLTTLHNVTMCYFLVQSVLLLYSVQEKADASLVANWAILEQALCASKRTYTWVARTTFLAARWWHPLSLLAR